MNSNNNIYENSPTAKKKNALSNHPNTLLTPLLSKSLTAANIINAVGVIKKQQKQHGSNSAILEKISEVESTRKKLK